MSYYLLQSPEGAEHGWEGGVMFSKSNKRCARKTLALQTEPKMLCSNCRKKSSFEKGPGVFQRGAVVGHT